MQDSQENYTHLYLHQDISYGPPAPCPPAIYIDRSLLHNGPTACGQTQWVAFESLAQTYVRESAYSKHLNRRDTHINQHSRQKITQIKRETHLLINTAKKTT